MTRGRVGFVLEKSFNRDIHKFGTNSSRKVQITNISWKNFPPLRAKTPLKNHLPELFDIGNINIIYRVEF